jgi:hypothetical protein
MAAATQLALAWVIAAAIAAARQRSVAARTGVLAAKAQKRSRLLFTNESLIHPASFPFDA